MAQPVQEEKINRPEVSARDLKIWGSMTRHYWKWETTGKYTSGGTIEVAELIKVIYLLIIGNYEGEKLTEGVMYEVNFIVELKNNLVMNGPVTLTIIHETKETRTEDLNQMTKNKVIKLKVGEFTAKRNCDVKFSMMNLTGTWQKGLVVIGASISAKV